MKHHIPTGVKSGGKTRLSNNKLSGIIVVGMVVLLVLPSIACRKTNPATVEEILNQAANVTQAKYDCYSVLIDSSGSSRELWFANVRVKGNKMRVGLIQPDESIEEYLIDFDEHTMYVWNPPENKPTEMKNAWEIPQFTSAVLWAKSFIPSNPQVIGTETIDKKECLVVQHGNLSTKAWVWAKHPFVVQIEFPMNDGKMVFRFRNIDFGNIADSAFGLPGPVSPIGSGTTIASATAPGPSPPLDILSPNDSLELVSVDPAPGTLLKKGASVQFSVTVKYELKSVERAIIGAILCNENGSGIGFESNSSGSPGIEVQKGFGKVVIEGAINVDTIVNLLKSDKVNLELSLDYQISSRERRVLVRRFFKDCFFVVE